jgi:hypothetical protein
VKTLIIFSKKNKGLVPLFTICDIFDWYDGPIYGIGNIKGTKDFYLFNIVAWDLTSNMKIFAIINITSSWLKKFKDAINHKNKNPILSLLEKYVRQYYSDIFLLKTENINNIEYDIIKGKAINLEVYTNIEKVVNQNREEMQKWFDLF